jgi:hypothetical protein
MPSGSITGIAYDYGGRAASATMAPIGASATAAKTVYDASGAVAANTMTTKGIFSSNFYFDGAPISAPDPSACPDGTSSSCSEDPVIDTRNLLVIGSAEEETDAAGSSVAYSSSFGFDNDGRIDYTTSIWCDSSGQQGGCSWTDSVSKNEMYDAEDHLTAIGTQVDNDSGILYNHYYSWGPNGHIVTMGAKLVLQTTQTWTPWLYQGVHWDGDAIAFETRQDGSLANYQLGADGDYAPGDTGYAGVTYFDRDLSNTAIANHNASGHSAFDTYAAEAHIQPENRGAMFDETVYSAGTPTGSQPTFFDNNVGSLLTYDRLDGVTDGQGVIQGVRNFDPGTQQWSTPDVYEGRISDPETQSKYMWNNNNPVAYSDPSGYDTIYFAERSAKVLGFDHMFIVITDDRGHIKEILDFGPSQSGVAAFSSSSKLQKGAAFDQDLKAFNNSGTTGNSVDSAYVIGVAACEGKCTISNGGFDEDTANAKANQIDVADHRYGPGYSNSNTGFGAVCAASLKGGQQSCDRTKALFPNQRTPGYNGHFCSTTSIWFSKCVYEQ